MTNEIVSCFKKYFLISVLTFVDNEIVEERRVNCCKHLFYNVCFLILITIMVFLCYSFFTDVNTKYEQELGVERARIYQCMVDFDENYCSPRPPPMLAEKCKELDFCRKLDPTTQIKTHNVLARMTTEILNDFTEGLSPKSLGLLGAIVMCALCCVCKCITPTVRRNKDGKIEVKIDKQQPLAAIEPEPERKKSRKALKSSRYSESDSDSDETMSRSEKKALKKFMKKKMLEEMNQKMLMNA